MVSMKLRFFGKKGLGFLHGNYNATEENKSTQKMFSNDKRITKEYNDIIKYFANNGLENQEASRDQIVSFTFCMK